MTEDPRDVRFQVDHMLIKLGKYLRILGFDAAWDPGLRTHEMILRANREGRVFLTRNRRLAAEYPPADRVLLIEDDQPAKQLRRVVEALHLDPQRKLFTRCIRCNVELHGVPDREAVRRRVHPNVFARHERFFTCPSCGTVFWHGSHVRNTCAKLGLTRPEPGGSREG